MINLHEGRHHRDPGGGVKKRFVPGRLLTHAEKSWIDDAAIRAGGISMLKIPVEALTPEQRRRYDAIRVGTPAKEGDDKPNGQATIAVLAAEPPIGEKGER